MTHSNQPENSTPAPFPGEDFVVLLQQSQGRLLGYVMSLLGRRADAEDVLQRASVIMWRKFDQFETGSNFMAWASTICFYEAKNFLRTSSRSPLRFDDDLLATIAAERADDLRFREKRLAALEDCIRKLPARDRTLIEGVYRERKAAAELAEELNRAPQTLYNRLNLARRALAACVTRKLNAESA